MPRIYGIGKNGAIYSAPQPTAYRRCCECRRMVPIDDFPVFADSEGRKRMRPYCKGCEPAVMARAAREMEIDAKRRERARLHAKYRHKAVVVDGEGYRALTDAAAALGVSRVTLRKLLEGGETEYNGHSIRYGGTK